MIRACNAAIPAACTVYVASLELQNVFAAVHIELLIVFLKSHLLSKKEKHLEQG